MSNPVAIAVPEGVSPQTIAIMSAVAGWQCDCAGRCSAAAAMDCLYRQSADLLSGTKPHPRPELVLMRPLAVVVSHQKTAEGQVECAAFAQALAQGDYAGALHHCRRLIELGEARATVASN